MIGRIDLDSSSSALIVGALGRLFHPGPDPMGRIWLTIVLGIVCIARRRPAHRRRLGVHPRASSIAVVLVALDGRQPAAADAPARLDRIDGEGLAAARERAHGREPPVVVAPDVCLDAERPLVGARRPRSRAPRRGAAAAAGRARGRSRSTTPRTSPVITSNSCRSRDRALVDVAADDQLRAGVDEPREHVVAARDGLLARAPRRADHLVVQRRPRGARPARACRSLLVGTLELRVADAARLVPPRPHRVDADDVRVGAGERRLGRLPLALELAPGRA